MTLFVNLFGGPGTGKSTTAAALYAELKKQHINTELITEYAKERVWDEHYGIFKNQIYIFGKQHNRMHRIHKKVDIAITDCPILLSSYYAPHNGQYPDSFYQLVLDTHNQYNNLNIYLERTTPYHKEGRMQTYDEAKEIDVGIQKLLKQHNLIYHTITVDENTTQKIQEIIHEHQTNT